MDKKTVVNIDKLNACARLEKESDNNPYNRRFSEYHFENLIIDFKLDLYDIKTSSMDFENLSIDRVVRFKNCDFIHPLNLKLLGNYEVEFSNQCTFKSIKSSRIFNNLSFIDSIIESVDFENAIMGSVEGKKGKVRFRNCDLHQVNFRNTTFHFLADFWRSTFHQPANFYKTDFNATAVFSAATFKENVLFTYASFNEKAIFGRTQFLKGLDLSQSIIGGELQIFDLSFDYKNYKAVYAGTDNEEFEELINHQHKIPKINKVTTFQILKNQYSKQGNHIDEVTMRKEEKKAFSQLVQSRKTDHHWTKSTSGDRFILWLNRWSNHYKSDFRNGISFTIVAALLFMSLTFLTTGVFWNRLILDGEVDSNVIGFTIKSFITFLNPVHELTYINDLKPYYGIPYVFDFLGRIAVGFGIYQTVQAFRKYR
ncbi:hypothetical protein JCM19314_3681 [Nonlabens ulvanivorans]|uniref:Pentapeptide repeat-containing protein n=1 Tax=Nonlabens ulvanivorans TaxID=906888 RepID=A0A090QW05_NONUL|nr:pentapeptide repeat-containing protein [Nonlabens ulvanivorans]GAK99636.1 hypothetical protein JCM19314_3681 [Nonlabens ulvanivorans]